MFFLKLPTAFRPPEMSRTELWEQSKHFLPTLMASAIGVVLSMGGGLLVSQWEDRVAIREFQSVAENQSGILQNGINQYLSRLVALRALFESSRDEVSRRQFEIFAERTLRGQTAIQSVSWIPRVSHAERAARERSAIDDGIPGYHIKSVGLGPDGSLAPSPERDEYFPIFYSTEKPKTSPVFGIDLASERKRREIARLIEKEQHLPTCMETFWYPVRGPSWSRAVSQAHGCPSGYSRGSDAPPSTSRPASPAYPWPRQCRSSFRPHPSRAYRFQLTCRSP